MGRLREFWRRSFDVRPDEIGRMVYMAAYLLLVLLAYYILKPVSRAMFINRFEIDNLPYLYIVIAFAGGLMAYFYTKLRRQHFVEDCGECLHVRNDRRLSADLAFAFDQLALAPVRVQRVRQLVQHHARLAGLARSIECVQYARGEAFVRPARIQRSDWGSIRWRVHEHHGALRRIPEISAGECGFVLLAYFAFLGSSSRPQVSLKQAKGAEEEETYSLRELGGYISRYRHLQVIMAIIALPISSTSRWSTSSMPWRS